MKRFAIIAIVLPVLAGCHTVYNWTGAHQRKAEQEAREWASHDPALANAEIVCKKHDSDNDGDVTCTVHGPDRVTLECPTRRLVRALEDVGCKETQRLTGRLTRPR